MPALTVEQKLERSKANAARWKNRYDRLRADLRDMEESRKLWKGIAEDRQETILALRLALWSAGGRKEESPS